MSKINPATRQHKSENKIEFFVHQRSLNICIYQIIYLLYSLLFEFYKLFREFTHNFFSKLVTLVRIFNIYNFLFVFINIIPQYSKTLACSALISSRLIESDAGLEPGSAATEVCRANIELANFYNTILFFLGNGQRQPRIHQDWTDGRTLQNI